MKSTLTYTLQTIPAMIATALLLSACGGIPAGQLMDHDGVVAENLGEEVNSETDDYAMFLHSDRLYFTSDRPTAEGYIQGDDLWFTDRDRVAWSRSLNYGGKVNTQRDEGAPFITADGEWIYFVMCDTEDGLGDCDIYAARMDFNGKWQEIRNLGDKVNSKYWDSQPFLSPDGEYLYFSSDRPGGEGGCDIWRSKRLRSGRWGTPRNLGEVVNSGGDEKAPTIAPNGEDLFFTSDGHPGLGGYDLYQAAPNPFPPGAVVVLSGTVRERSTRNPLAAKLTVRDASSGEILSAHDSNAYTGEYIIVLTAGAVYEVTASSGTFDPVTERFDLLSRDVYGEITHDFLLGEEAAAGDLSASIRADVLDFSLIRNTSENAGLTIEEIVGRETVPLLNYVFFEEDGSKIPGRYALLTPAQAKSYALSSLPEGTLERYHHMLNIVALRMQQRPAATITITGTTDGRESSSVARARAAAVASYLTDVWGIDAGRISTNSRALPAAASSSRSAQGRAENRRVEITSTDAELLAPIETSEVQRLLKPDRVRFYPSITAEEGLERWKFQVTDEGRVLRDSDGYASYPDSIAWNWRSLQGELPTGDTLEFTLYARDVLGNEVTTQPQAIPVNVLTLERKNVEKLPGRTIEKISLILFDYDRSDLGARNRAILARAADRLTTKSTLIIRGYTDALGDEKYNQRLSERRAEAVRTQLDDLLDGAPMRSEGVGESRLLFDNALPEGRFYCRTVQILIETIE